MSFLSGAAYLALPRDQGNWLIKDLLPLAGLAVCYGKPKIGKSFFSLGLAEAISNGHPHFLGLPILHHGPVAYLQIDTPRSIWHERLVKAQRDGHDFSNIYIADSLSGTPFPFNILEHGGWLKKELLQITEAAGEPPVLVIVDTLRELFSGDENDSSVMRNVIAAIVGAVGPNVAILFLSHKKKEIFGQGDDLMSDLRGSSYVAGRMDCIIGLRKNTIVFQSRATGEDQIAVSQHEENGMWMMDAEEARLLKTMETLYFDNPGESVNELARLLAGAFRWHDGNKEKEKALTKEAARGHWRRKLALIARVR